MTGPTSTDQSDAGDFLAALANLPLLDSELAHEEIAKGGHQPLHVLELLPDDGLGVGDAYLYRLPARVDGDHESRHRTTWAVSIRYEHDNDGDFHVLTGDTEQEVRDTYSAVVADRIAAGWPDPN